MASTRGRRCGADGRLLSHDFLGVYPTGFADLSDHVGQLDDGPTMAEFELSDERIMTLSDSLVMFSYRAQYRRLRAGSPGELEVMYISSLWCLRDGAWVNVFSQDTPAA
ncbi:MAG: nuclear transport factor 2 family protein [Ilumatobacteraceae bacterium]|nr:nuclear transport factor 2 family protein [Ilumatobacteraceae bacterium]